MIEGAAASVTSNRSASSKSEFEFVDFKTPFSLRGQTPVSGRPVMMPPGTEASVTATKDLSDFFEETRRAKDLPVMLGGNKNVEGGEDGIYKLARQMFFHAILELGLIFALYLHIQKKLLPLGELLHLSLACRLDNTYS